VDRLGGEMTTETKPCPICGNPFGPTSGFKRWHQQKTCSRACSVVNRKLHAGGDHAIGAEQSRERSKAAMDRQWQVRKAVAAAKAAPAPSRQTREDEEEIIARFVAERGVTRAAPAGQEFIEARRELARPQPMAGWRG